MGRYWYIFSVDNTEYLSYSNLHGDFPRLRSGVAGRLVRHLAIPVKPSLSNAPGSTINILKTSSRPTQENVKSTLQFKPCLEILPTELLWEVFHHLDLVSCFRLSLVSERLWNVGLPYTHLKAAENMSPWVGLRLICVNDECKPSDRPAGFLTAEEEARADQGIHEDFHVSYVSDRRGLAAMVLGRFEKIEREFDIFGELRRLALDETHHLPRSKKSYALRVAFGELYGDYYPKGESWILRNLTTKEIVQGDRLFVAFHGVKPQQGPDFDHPGLGDAILCRISWSSNYPRAGLNRRAWAGHRFDVCTKKHLDSGSSGDWKDITDEIIDELSVALNLKIRVKRAGLAEY